ncbi:hypothetical protein KUTeg_007399 [Tegillarca granosa]|uniref:Uncharacterized protein n=1 Tax=Tegillarca granosa TaxID=220873 RepID=A0ABQ9FD60_TEGGR|nr:hypothetical protein KUTeg_007399 [Tegillarca granosa]
MFYRIEGFKKFQETYGQLDIEAVNLKGTGWFTLDPFEITKFGGQWKSADFKAGDVLIFTMRTVHMSTSNLTDQVRISCDTRWQPASEPADRRYVGDFQKVPPKFGLYSDDTKEDATQVTIEDFRQKWRI